MTDDPASTPLISASIANQPAEFSRPVDSRNLHDAPAQLVADGDERAALAKRFGLEAIDSLYADISYSIDASVITATGRLTADIVQQCVVSLDPFASRIEQEFAISFQPADLAAQAMQDESPAEDDSFEIEADDCDIIAYEDHRFDIGEAVAQTLALALDPFPRGPNAQQVARQYGLVDAVPKDNPFAILQQLKDADA